MDKKIEGICEQCNKDVYSNQLFVEERGDVYHLSCFNNMKKEEEKDK